MPRLIGRRRVHPASKLPGPIGADQVDGDRTRSYQLELAGSAVRCGRHEGNFVVHPVRHKQPRWQIHRQNPPIFIQLQAKIIILVHPDLGQGLRSGERAERAANILPGVVADGPEHRGGGIVQHELGGLCGLRNQASQDVGSAQLVVLRPGLPPVCAAAHQQHSGDGGSVEHNGLNHSVDVQKGPQHQQLALVHPWDRPGAVCGEEQGGLAGDPLEVHPGGVVPVEAGDQHALLLSAEDN
mmetsp:Transcript_105107/g.240837  ORF Transcript_105107/g.240837 Transcript_105107/m.240837 type:complete len:240 (+) Transcript_105107:653-1372(+)